MKKRKILYLIPFAALVLSGCTFQEGWQATTGWLNDNIWTPVVNFFEGLFGKKEDKKEEEEEDDPKPTPTPTPTDPVHAGTLDDPFDAADAKLVGSSVESGQYTPQAYYVKGVVQDITEEFDPSYGSYTFVIEEGFKGYRMKNGENKAKFAEGDIEAGDEVVMYGPIQRYNDSYELSGTLAGQGYVVSVTKAAPTDADLVDLLVQGEPQTLYAPGVAYNHNGLTATAVYDDGVTQDVTSAAKWDISKATAEIGDTSITITASFKNVSNSISVDVTVSADPVHAGTLEDPLDAADACLLGSQLQESSKDDKHPSEKKYYIKGVVQEVVEFSSQYGNFTFNIENGFQGYRLKNGPSKAAFTSADDLVVGDTVVMYAQILNFKGTYETNDGYIYSIEKEPVAVEGVSLNESEIAIEVGDHATLSASVLPEGASQDVEWSVAQDGDVISFENGVVTGLSVGSATITATSVADPSKSASCVITVNEATKVLTGITIDATNAKTSYYAGENYSSEGLVVTAHYENSADEVVTEYVSWGFSSETASIGDTSVTITATYGNEFDDAVIAVTVQEKPAEKGSEGNPYTVAEARAAVDAGTGVTGVYARGIVTRIAFPFANGSMSFYFSDDGSSTNELEAYKLTATADPGLEVGDVVVVTGNLVKFSSTYEFDAGCTLATLEKATTLSVEITGTPQQTEYAIGADYNHNGLVATAHLSSGVGRDVTASAQWSLSKAKAEVGDTSITVTATYGGQTSEGFVINVTVSEDAPILLEASINFSAQGYTNQQAIASATFGDFTVTFDKGTNSNAPKYYTSGSAIRVYGSNTVTVTAPSTAEIRGITIGFGSSDGSNEITADSGTYANGVWSGNASSVKFTVGGTSGNRRFVTLTVSYVNK